MIPRITVARKKRDSTPEGEEKSEDKGEEKAEEKGEVKNEEKQEDSFSEIDY